MSILNVTTLKHEASATDNITLDSAGNTVVSNALTVPSLVLPSGGSFAIKDSSNVDTYIGVDSAGRVTMQYQPAFWATGSGNVSGADPFILTELLLNRGNCFNTSTGYFTAPVAGVYRAAITALTNSSTVETFIYINGVKVIWGYQYGHVEQGHAEILCQLSANDTIKFGATSGTLYGDYTSISVTFIG
jgi:hypothetical protein